MSRLKTFGTYLLMLVAFYIFSTLIIMGYLSTTYSSINGKIEENLNVNIKINKAESTFVNGYLQGEIKNNLKEDIKYKYIKIDLISKRGNIILTKYIEIDELKKDEVKNFTINFRAENIKSYKIKIIDEYLEENSEETPIKLVDAENQEIEGISVLLAVIIMLRYLI